MKYMVFTDGACNTAKSKISSAFVIFTEEDFIVARAYVFDGLHSYNAETIAIGSAAEYLLKEVNILPDDKVVIITDSKQARDYLSKAKEIGGLKCANKTTQFAIKMYIDLCNRVVDVKIKQTKGHRDGSNENKYADRLAKQSLRMAVKEG